MCRIIILILFVFPLFLNAQNESKLAEVFCTIDESNKNSIRIKWLYKSVYDPNGFDIYRQDNGNDWKKLNNNAIKPIQALPVPNKLDNESKDLFKAMKSTNFEEFRVSIIRAFVLIKAIYVNELADYIGISYIDNNIELGKSYTYKVCLAGSSDPIGISKPIIASEYIKPACPENIKLIRTKKRVDISWKPDLYRYYAVDIYRKTSEDSNLVKITKVPRAIQKEQADKYSEESIFFQDTAINYNSNYYYQFVAIDYFGNSSELSSEYTVPAADFIPPAQAYDIIPTSSSLNALVRLDWKLIEEEDLVGVSVYWSNLPDKEYIKISNEIIPKSTLTFNHSDVPVGSNYYRIVTIDIAGNENYSAPVFIDMKDVKPPTKPSGLISESGEGFITLKWNKNTEPDLKGYHVQRSLRINSNINNSYINVTKEPIKENTYTESLPKNVRNEFVYRIVAIDTSFNRSIPSENTLARMPDVTPPLKPLIIKAQADTNMATITWLPNTDIDLEGYNLYRALSVDSLTITKVNFNLISKELSSYKDRNVKPGQSYNYFLEAIDSSGNSSERSAGFYCQMQNKDVSGTIKIDKNYYNSKKKLLMLEWTALIDVDIKGYVVYQQKGKGFPFKPITGLFEENHINISINENSTIYIKCYTEGGQTVQSESFNIETNQNQ